MVRTIHAAILISLGITGLSFVFLLVALASVWTYSYKTGMPKPDATHVDCLSDHSEKSYILHGQRAAIDVIEMMLLSSLLLLVPSVAAQRLFERLFPPRMWDYEPFEADSPSQSKRPAYTCYGRYSD